MADKTQQLAGMDESGKGDLFGAPVCATVVADRRTLDHLRAMGVRDSKVIEEPVELYELEALIRGNARVNLRSLSMARYNALMAKPTANLNKLLAWLHAHALSDAIKAGAVDHALLDQFATRDYVSGYLRQFGVDPVGGFLQQKPHAESATSVAAASICARVGYLDQMEALGQRLGQSLRRGCSREAQAQAQRILIQRGDAVFCSVTKLHFKCARRMRRDDFAGNNQSPSSLGSTS